MKEVWRNIYCPDLQVVFIKKVKMYTENPLAVIVIAMVIEDLDPMEGFKRAWSVFFSNIPLYLTVAVINFFGLLVINIVLSIPLFAVIGVWLLVDSFKFFGMMVGLVLFGIIYALILAPVNGFKEITWVLTYSQAAKLDFKEAEEEFLELEKE